MGLKTMHISSNNKEIYENEKSATQSSEEFSVASRH